MITNCPFSTSTNSMRSPESTPKAARTRTGMVICPLEVIVAAAIRILSIIYIPYFIVRILDCQVHHSCYSKNRLYPSCYQLFVSYHSHHNSRRLCLRVVHALGGFREIGGLGVGDVGEGLWVAVG